MELASLKAINAERRARRAVILLTDLSRGADRVVRESDVVEGELTPLVRSAFATGKSGSIQADGRDWFLTVHLPQPRIVVIGAVHISQALAPMARIAGFSVEIIDPRTAFATPGRFPEVPLRAEWPEDVLRDSPLDAYTAVAALTHDPKIDDVPLAEALRAQCFYVGALGSRKTHAKRLERLSAQGLGPDALNAIHAPIGLNIGASSPAEIAVAVLAEVIESFRRRGLGGGAA